MDPLPDAAQVDAQHPSAARIYDYLLGGKDNFAPDRALADQMQAEAGEGGGVRELARINRSFILAAARWCASMLAIEQFLDLGCGLPLRPAVHDTAREGCREATVVYVDKDPMVVSHVAALQSGPGLAAVKADAGQPERVLEVVADLEVPGGGRLIDLSRPACTVLGGTLSAMDADTARSAVRAYAEALAPGSAVIISCASYADAETGERMAQLYGAAEPGWRNHDRETVASFFVAANLRVMWGQVRDVRCWPLSPDQTGLAETASAAVVGGIGIRD